MAAGHGGKRRDSGRNPLWMQPHCSWIARKIREEYERPSRVLRRALKRRSSGNKTLISADLKLYEHLENLWSELHKVETHDRPDVSKRAARYEEVEVSYLTALENFVKIYNEQTSEKSDPIDPELGKRLSVLAKQLKDGRTDLLEEDNVLSEVRNLLSFLLVGSRFVPYFEPSNREKSQIYELVAKAAFEEFGREFSVRQVRRCVQSWKAFEDRIKSDN
jgi:hypothetical protein